MARHRQCKEGNCKLKITHHRAVPGTKSNNDYLLENGNFTAIDVAFMHS